MSPIMSFVVDMDECKFCGIDECTLYVVVVEKGECFDLCCTCRVLWTSVKCANCVVDVNKCEPCIVDVNDCEVCMDDC